VKVRSVVRALRRDSVCLALRSKGLPAVLLRHYVTLVARSHAVLVEDRVKESDRLRAGGDLSHADEGDEPK
jgi:hypothetical protein